jgi:hypothetical protein
LGSIKRGSAWIISFGPVGAGSDGYLVRVETNARALASLGFEVHVLEISARTASTSPWPAIVTHPAFPTVVAKQRILGPIDLWADIRSQIALAVGLVRHWRRLRSSRLVVIEGGLLALGFVARLFAGRQRPLFVFDLITLMSSLHRHGGSACTPQCKLRRSIWRVLEFTCVRCADLVTTGSKEDLSGLTRGPARVLPHVVVPDGAPIEHEEDPNMIGFLGSGSIAPNREAVDFISASVFRHPRLKQVRCRVIGDDRGYNHTNLTRFEFVGFSKDAARPLSSVSVCCAPMLATGGVSTKVLACLSHGKRTVCTAEAAQGLVRPRVGLWIAEREEFGDAVVEALAFPWSSTLARELAGWMDTHHGLCALQLAWEDLLAELR